MGYVRTKPPIDHVPNELEYFKFAKIAWHLGLKTNL